MRRVIGCPTLARVVVESNAMGSEMALRLSNALGRSLESWLGLQDNYDLKLIGSDPMADLKASLQAA